MRIIRYDAERDLGLLVEDNLSPEQPRDWRPIGTTGIGLVSNPIAATWFSNRLAPTRDFSVIEAAIEGVEAVGNGPLPVGASWEAIAACEVLARLCGHPGPEGRNTPFAAEWVKVHPLTPNESLLRRACRVIDRILTPPSGLLDLWLPLIESDYWQAGMVDLRIRLRPPA